MSEDNSTKPRCERCRFWDDQLDTGQCRRYAPRLVLYQVELPENLDNNGDSAVWPFTHPYDWCGEFQPKESTVDAPPADLLSLNLWQLDWRFLSQPACNALENAGIKTVGDLIAMDYRQLKMLVGIGEVTADRIRIKLAELGLSLRGEFRPKENR